MQGVRSNQLLGLRPGDRPGRHRRPDGADAVLNAARDQALKADESKLKSRIMQRILLNDAEIRHLAEPWLEDLDHMLAGRPKTQH